MRVYRILIVFNRTYALLSDLSGKHTGLAPSSTGRRDPVTPLKSHDWHTGQYRSSFNRSSLLIQTPMSAGTGISQ